jgi:hypothetical protein
VLPKKLPVLLHRKVVLDLRLGLALNERVHALDVTQVFSQPRHRRLMRGLLALELGLALPGQLGFALPCQLSLALACLFLSQFLQLLVNALKFGFSLLYSAPCFKCLLRLLGLVFKLGRKLVGQFVRLVNGLLDAGEFLDAFFGLFLDDTKSPYSLRTSPRRGPLGR